MLKIDFNSMPSMDYIRMQQGLEKTIQILSDYYLLALAEDKQILDIRIVGNNGPYLYPRSITEALVSIRLNYPELTQQMEEQVLSHLTGGAKDSNS